MYYNSKMKSKALAPNDLILFYDDHFEKFPRKSKLHWMGPYKVEIAHDNGSFDLVDFEGTSLLTRINGYRLKKYYK